MNYLPASSKWGSLRVCFVVMLFYLLCQCSTAAVDEVEEDPLILEDGSTLSFNFRDYTASGQLFDNLTIVLPMSTVTINVVEIPSSVDFVLVQAHSFLINVTLSYSKAIAPHMYTNGTDIGLIRVLTSKQKLAQFVLTNANTDSNATVLIAAQGYGGGAPVPGGCNMEFSVEIAPFLSVGYNSSVIWVESQPAASSVAAMSCEMQHVELEMYHAFLPERDFSGETYFRAIRGMMTVADVRRNARKVDASEEGSPMRRFYSSYPGTGSVYSVLAVGTTSEAAYIPAVSYGCNVSFWTDRCEVLTSTFSKLLCATVFFLGFFVCFFGHRFFKCEMFLLGFLAGGIAAYILLVHYGTLDNEVTQGLAVTAGILAGSAWLLFWCICGMPLISVFLATLSLGFLVASLLMYAGIGDIPIFDSDINFWVIFASVTLTIPILCSSCIQVANVVCCGVLGAYAVVIPIDHYIGANLKYILVNTIRRVSDKNFKTALIDPPFQSNDLILVFLWLGIASLGISYQLYYQHGRPPFPASPLQTCRQRPQRDRRAANARTPLLFADQAGRYGSVVGVDNLAAGGSDQQPRNFPILPKFPPPSAPPTRNKELF